MALNDSLLNQSVALALRIERDRAGMTQQQIADASGVPLDTIQRYFRGKFEMKVGMLTAICAAMGMTPAAILKRAFDEAEGGEAAIYADLRERFGAPTPTPVEVPEPDTSIDSFFMLETDEVSEGGAKVTDIASRQAAAEKLTTEGVEKIRAEGRAAASEDDDATRDEPEGP